MRLYAFQDRVGNFLCRRKGGGKLFISVTEADKIITYRRRAQAVHDQNHTSYWLAKDVDIKLFTLVEIELSAETIE